MLHSNRIGQGLPLNTIILIALGLIVLVIIIFLVQQQVTKGGRGLANVTDNTCAPENEAKPFGTDCDVIYATFKDLKVGEICCRKGTAK